MYCHRLSRVLLNCALLVGIAGCTSAEQHYSIRRSDISCQEANRFAYQAMSHLDYEITEFQPAKLENPGIIQARKKEGQEGEIKGKIAIVCTPTAVSLSPREHSGLLPNLTFARGFFLAFTSLADRGKRGSSARRGEKTAAVEGTRGGLEFNITPVPGLEAKLDFGEDLQAAGILPVRATVANNSTRSYRFDTGDIRLRVRGQRQSVSAMPVERAAKLLAAAARKQEEAGGPPAKEASFYLSLLADRTLGSRTVKKGERVEGFLFFPVANYVRARALLTDVATGETEGFMIEF